MWGANLMHMSNLKLEIISPEGVIFEGDCKMAVVPLTLGDIGFMHGHESVIALLREGEITVFDAKDNLLKKVEVKGGGYAEMECPKKLSILVEGE